MLTLTQFLEEIGQSNQVVVLPADEVERLVELFGSRVRSMGIWNKATDGSVEIPVSNIAEAAKRLGNSALTEAVAQLKTPEQFTGLMNESSAASKLIEALADLEEKQFVERVERCQASSDPRKSNGCGARSPASCSASRCPTFSGRPFRGGSGPIPRCRMGHGARISDPRHRGDRFPIHGFGGETSTVVSDKS